MKPFTAQDKGIDCTELQVVTVTFILESNCLPWLSHQIFFYLRMCSQSNKNLNNENSEKSPDHLNFVSWLQWR